MIEHTAIIILTTGLFGAVAGIIGSWLFLEQKSLFADTIAHATFPGITFAFLLFGSKNPIIFMIAAMTGSLLATYAIQHLQKNCTLKKDTILGIILASAFGIGSMLLSKIQQMNIINSALITNYFLGNPATIMQQDCIMILVISTLCLLGTIIYKKTYSIILFDPTFSKTVGISNKHISFLILCMITLTIVMGLQIVGIILMSSLLINPAAAAYQWTKNLTSMMALAGILGLIETVAGMYLSSQLYHVPPGPMIIIIATTVTFFSIFFSKEGIIIHWYNNKKEKKELSTLQLLSRFLLFNEAKTDPFYPHNLIMLKKIGKQIPDSALLKLKQEGFIKTPQKNFWSLTPKGLDLLQKHKDLPL